MRPIKTIVGVIAAAMLVLGQAPASADVDDAIFPASGPCAMTASISIEQVNSAVYLAHGDGSATCPGNTHVTVCIQESLDGGTTFADLVCGSGGATSGATASASADAQCKPGLEYRTKTRATYTGQGPGRQGKKSGVVSCPPLAGSEEPPP